MGRLLAFDLITENDDAARDSIVSKLVDDPCLPLRRKAIDAWLKKAESVDDSEAIGALGFALTKARDLDQITKIVGLLKEHGVRIDIQKQLGFINEWYLVGPFDNTEEKGFDVPFGPEQTLTQIDLEASYPDGKDEQQVSWKKQTTAESTAVIDLNESVDKNQVRDCLCLRGI